MTNSENLHNNLNMSCSHHTKHSWSRGIYTDTYPVQLCRRVVQHIQKMERWNIIQYALQQASMTQALTAEIENSSERDEATLSALPISERRNLELAVRKLHHNCGHPPNHVLVRMLRWKGAKEDVLAAARSLQCSACEDAKPPGAKPVAASHENREPWKTVGCDLAEWNHPISETRKVHLWICVDEATKFTVGHVWAEGQQVGNIDGSRVLELLQERWIAIFGRMHTLRTDPEGAWRNKEVHERLSDMQIVLDVHPGEASWQASVTENTIGIVKDTMTRIVLERPDLKATEVLAAAVLAHNEMERVRGFSPAQWALGRSPNWDQSFFDSGNEIPDPSFLEHLQGMETAREAWLNARNEERIKRASRSRNRPLAHFRPGDEVDFWRRGKGKGARPHIKGRFHGGAVVLATSTENDEEDGSRKPRKVVWITHAGTLIKCAPEHLRYSSERARQSANMGQAQRLPWTHEGLDGWLRKGQYESLPITDTPDDHKLRR